MIYKKELAVRELMPGGMLLSYGCSGSCKYYMYSCSPKWDADWISEADITSYLSQLSTTIKPSPYGRHSIDLNSGLHSTSGELFLNLQLLLQATNIAFELGLPSTFVETNRFWCKSDEVTKDKLRQLKDAGLKGTMISVNPLICMSSARMRQEGL